MNEASFKPTQALAISSPSNRRGSVQGTFAALAMGKKWATYARTPATAAFPAADEAP